MNFPEMGDERRVTILCGLLKSCNPTVGEVSKEMNLIENRDRMVWLTGKRINQPISIFPTFQGAFTQAVWRLAMRDRISYISP